MFCAILSQLYHSFITNASPIWTGKHRNPHEGITILTKVRILATIWRIFNLCFGRRFVLIIFPYWRCRVSDRSQRDEQTGIRLCCPAHFHFDFCVTLYYIRPHTQTRTACGLSELNFVRNHKLPVRSITRNIVIVRCFGLFFMLWKRFLHRQKCL